MKIKYSLKLSKLIGMADWSEWGEAIARAMGYADMGFIEAYERNIGIQNKHIIETNPFAKAINLLYNDIQEDSNIKRKFVYGEHLDTFSISGNRFTEEIIGVAIREGLDTNDLRFPRSANKISNQLNYIKSNLQALGIDVSIRQSRTIEDKDNGFNKNTMIIDIKTVKPSSLPPYYSEGPYAVRPGRDSRVVTILSVIPLRIVSIVTILLATFF